MRYFNTNDYLFEYQGGQQNILLSESLSYRKDSHMQANKFRYYSQIGDKKEDKLRAIVVNADEEDNPILVLLKLRK